MGHKRAKSVQQSKAILVGQSQVQQKQARALSLKNDDGLRGGLGHKDASPTALQNQSEHLSAIGVVIDHQH